MAELEQVPKAPPPLAGVGEISYRGWCIRIHVKWLGTVYEVGAVLSSADGRVFLPGMARSEHREVALERATARTLQWVDAKVDAGRPRHGTPAEPASPAEDP